MDTRAEKLAVAALLRPEVSGPISVLLGRPDERLAQGLLERMVENILLARQRDYLIGKRFATRQDAIAFETQLMAALRPHLARLARMLVINPSAVRLRAPAFPRSKKKSTKEMLDQPL